MPNSLILVQRTSFHRAICANILGKRSNGKALSVADSSSASSIALSDKIAEKMGHSLCKKPPEGQTAGLLFSQYTNNFLEGTFKYLHHIRPGKWIFSVSQAKIGIAAYDQYAHLFQLQQILEKNKELTTALGGDYLITPDIVVTREPLPDIEINKTDQLVSTDVCVSSNTPLRSQNYKESYPILHASVSCKWTMRSDRAQNTRTEALNLIRNRKGKTPHIVAVTMEPLPTRIASIALGTGDVDCTYHAALYELLWAVNETGLSDQADLLNTMISGRRLRDISDLPFDLAT